jgi:hypothetical protein
MHRILLFAFVIISTHVFAQIKGGDVVYLKNGSVIKGIIIKNYSDSTLAIRTTDGSLFIFNNRDVARTLVDNAASTNKNSRNTYGNTNPHINNLWFGFNVEPQYQNIFYSKKQANAIWTQYTENLSLPGSGGVQTGFTLHYLPWGLVGVETGLQYHYYASRAVVSAPYNNVTAYNYTLNQLHNLEIPLLINVHSPGKKIRFYSADGFSAGLTLGGYHSISNFAQGYIGRDTAFTTHADSTTFIYATVLVSGGVQISVAHNILLNLTAAFRLSTGGTMGALNSFYVPSHYPFFPYSLGLNVEVLLHNPLGMKKSGRSYTDMPESVNPYEQQEKKLADAKITHQLWNDCIMIRGNGDTIKGKVQRSADYRLTGGLFNKGKVTFAHDDGSEEKMRASQFWQLYIPAEDSGYRKYITVIENPETGSKRVYRVVIDGKCQLLSQNISGSTPPLGVSDEAVEKYYYYYKDDIIPANFKGGTDNAGLLSQYKTFFSECPELVQKISARKFQSEADIVREFNYCLNSHH